jgi:hypothetical protein
MLMDHAPLLRLSGRCPLRSLVPSCGARPHFIVKLLLPFILAAILFPATGCISTHLVKSKARAHWEPDPEELREREVQGRPGYYALLPFTIVADIATCPFQIFFLIGSHSGSATIHGWPVPLP